MLRDRQRQFAASVLAGDASILPAIVPGRLGGEARMAVYRHNVFTVQTGALGDLFPVTRAIVGEDFFREAARQYLAATPSPAGDIGHVGGGWPDFIAGYVHAAELPYLADVGRLEQAWDQCFHGAEAAPFDLARLATVPADQHAALRFSLHPAMRLVASEFPVLSIWEVNQAGFDGDMEIAWDTGEHVLVRRSAADEVAVVPERLSAGAWEFLSAVRDGENLESAATRALAAEETFDLQGFLRYSVQCGIIVDLRGESHA